MLPATPRRLHAPCLADEGVVQRVHGVLRVRGGRRDAGHHHRVQLRRDERARERARELLLAHLRALRGVSGTRELVA